MNLTLESRIEIFNIINLFLNLNMLCTRINSLLFKVIPWI